MAKQVIHLSDGKKAVCKSKGGKAVTEEDKINCPKCLKWLEEKAEKEGDPLVWCRIINRQLNDGVDFQFTFEGKLYHLVNGRPRKIPKSLIVHLRGLHHPVTKLDQGEAGGNVLKEGSYNRYIVNELSEEEVSQIKKAG